MRKLSTGNFKVYAHHFLSVYNSYVHISIHVLIFSVSQQPKDIQFIVTED